MQNLDLIPIFQDFFADMRNVCGTEKTFHAGFYHQLMRSGLNPSQISREFRTANCTVDFVLYDENCRRITDLFEFKGGAYGTRSSLHDTVSPDYPIRDLEKLVAAKPTGARSWFVCIETPELGIALHGDAAIRVSERATKRGIGFIYCNPESGHFLYRSPGRELEQIDLGDLGSVPRFQSAPPSLGAESCVMTDFAAKAAHTVGAEDNFANLLYSTIRGQGAKSQQVALETYFNLAAVKQSRMQLRPDLTLFKEDVDGRFNLYRNGNPTATNDPVKLKNLRAIVEIKGSASLERQGPAQVVKAYRRDIEKLGTWRTLIDKGCQEFRISLREKPEYLLIGIDNRKSSLDQKVVSALRTEAKRSKVTFHYIYRGSIH